jgi:precorrin-8X/cobalt-precorrin-8 methylmutase
MSFTQEEPRINIGGDISEKSFEMIDEEIQAYEGYHRFAPHEQAVVSRLIHTTTCFSQVIDNIYFSPNSMQRLMKLLQANAKLIVDTNMIRSGLSEFYLNEYGNEVICYVNEPEVFKMAKENKTTRSYAAVQLAIEKFKDEPMVLACGNAPTFIYAAINTLIDLSVDLENVILLLYPVGFVNVVESKEYGKRFIEHFDKAEGIILEGRYGASTMIVANLHAAYRLIKDYDTELGTYNGKF